MSWLGVKPMKRFPGLVMKPMTPFIVASVFVVYGINKAQNAYMMSDEFKNDPRNPYKNAGGH